MILPMLQSDNAADDSVAGRIARGLGERIVSGALAPGTPVRQDHVAAAFRASHVPVREAFRVLEAQGLLIGMPRRGVRVAPLDAAAVQEVTEMRAALEALALGHAFRRLQAGDLEEASRALKEAQASSEIAVWERANRRFHRTITAPCAMPRLLAAIDALHQASARFLFATWKALDWQPRSEREHVVILERLRDGDLEAAVLALRRHILDAGEALMERLGSGGR